MIFAVSSGLQGKICDFRTEPLEHVLNLCDLMVSSGLHERHRMLEIRGIRFMEDIASSGGSKLVHSIIGELIPRHLQMLQ